MAEYDNKEANDLEQASGKVHDIDVNSLNQDLVDGQVVSISSSYWGILGQWSRKLDSYGVEARGIQRVTAQERSPQSYWGLCLLWASSGLTIGTFTTGTLGNFLFGLTFSQTVWITWGFGALGSAVSAYCAIFGKRNGLRALVNSRYVFGYYGAMIMSALNILTELVFGVLACILGGQTLNALSKDVLPTSWGIVIVGVASWLIATGGFKYVHLYERVAFIPPMIVFISLFSVGGKWFTNAAPEPLSSANLAGGVLSFAAIIFGSSSGWIPVAADYYIYFPEQTPSWKIFLISFLGIWVIPAFSITCGAGLATTLATNSEWATAFNNSNGSSAALIEIAFRHLGNVRYFFLFILAWSMVNNNIFNYYSISISMQLFGRWSTRIPRFFYTIVALVAIILISVLGRNNLYDILSDLVAIIAYWTIIYFVIFLEEHLIFRQHYLTKWLRNGTSGIGWDVEVWNEERKLPVGIAAMFAFVVGCAGAVVGMAQVWYVGPIAKKIGDTGADLGIELGFLFAGVVFPPLRYLELKKFGR